MASKAEPPQDKQEPNNDQGYIFKRDYKSSMRLNYNHFLIKEVAGYLLHPSIPTHQPNLRIADVGTGTGTGGLFTVDRTAAAGCGSGGDAGGNSDDDCVGKTLWVEGLKALFEEEGLVDVSRTEHTWPNYLRPLWSQSSMAATADVMAKIDSYNTKGSGMGMRFVEDLERESANGVVVDTPFQMRGWS
ncbi:hypothetical protein BCON_0122g00100 [Botryotinia convoluta]|uniref:Methyltransferase domain-containing protein n=1 Tax=Botryotinia convoluta TaxID=54673 RepID=A0A4Z1I982_9HELO|nr:hypothetical protein BCON_0122g00100 [Botryotinia convoluta]